MLSPVFWMAFAIVFWTVKTALDAGRWIDDLHVRKRVKPLRNEATEAQQAAPALERAA